MLAYRAFRTIQWVIERLPRGFAYALSVFLARFAWVFARAARRRLEFNLGMALPEKSRAEIVAIAWRNFRNHSKAYVDLMQLPRARVDQLRPLLHVRGEEHLRQALTLGRGVLVVSAHMGSWEIAAAIWASTITPVSLFAEELEPPELFNWYRSTRQRLGVSVLPLSRSGLRHVVDGLRAGEMVVTAVDRDLIGTGVEVPFFGHPAFIPTGPAALALRMGTPILPVTVYRLPDDSYQAVGYPALMPEATGDRDSDIRRVTEELVRRVETIIRDQPENWHMPHRIWAGTP